MCMWGEPEQQLLELDWKKLKKIQTCHSENSQHLGRRSKQLTSPTFWLCDSILSINKTLLGKFRQRFFWETRKPETSSTDKSSLTKPKNKSMGENSSYCGHLKIMRSGFGCKLLKWVISTFKSHPQTERQVFLVSRRVHDVVCRCSSANFVRCQLIMVENGAIAVLVACYLYNF